jgi:tetratricopeptide (TPR) repeat protein
VLAAGSSSATNANTATINTLEKKLFMQTFGDEDISHRLNRLEERVFGKTMSGTPEERIAHLQETTGASSDPVFGTPVPASVPTAPTTTAKPPALPSMPATSSVPKSDNNISKQNERFRVQAAEEEQINSLLGEGVTAWRQHNVDLALDRFTQVVRLDPQNAQAFFSLGIIYETKGDFQKALDNYQTADRLHPGSKEYTEAISQAQKKLTAKQRVDDKQTELTKLSQAALEAYNRGEYISALDMYKQIDEKFPNQAINEYNIGSVYLVMHQPEMALPYYKKARELDPHNEKISQAFDSVQTALKEQQARANAQAAASYSAPAGPSRRDRRSRSNKQQHNSYQSAQSGLPKGFITNYGLDIHGSSRGVRVKSVLPGMRAQAAGVQSGDLIRAVNGMVVNTTDDIDHIVSACNPFKQLRLTIQRDKRMLQLVL